MRRLILLVTIATLAQSASASLTNSPDQALPLPLAHPEFFGGGNQPGVENSPQGYHSPNWPSDHGSLLSDNLSLRFEQISQWEPNDRGSQGDGHNVDQNGPGDRTLLGAPDDSFTFGSDGTGDPILVHLSVSLNGVALGTTDGDPALNGPAPIPEPASVALVLFAFLVGGPLWRVRRREFWPRHRPSSEGAGGM